MKKRLIFYSTAVFVIMVLGAVIMTSATDTSPTKAPEPITQNEVDPETKTLNQEKSCLCCSDRIARLKEKVRKARERKQATEQIEIPTTLASEK